MSRVVFDSSPSSLVRWARRSAVAIAIFSAGLISRKAHADASASIGKSELVTYSDLSGLGVHVQRKRLDTPGASLTLEITIEQNARAGRFVQAECVVLRAPDGMKDLETIDASADLSEKAARRNSSDKMDSTFLVLGREIERAYLVFEFSNPGNADERYLLPVASVPKRHS
jgi:hypothetical protein